MTKKSIIKQLPIAEIHPGTILAKKLLCPEKGNVLLGAGIAISSRVKDVLIKKYPNLKLDVHIPVDLSGESITETQDSDEKKDRANDLFQLEQVPNELVALSAKQCYTSYYQAIKSFFNAEGDKEWVDLKKALAGVIKHVLKNPHSLQQLVALRLRFEYTISHAVNTTLYSLFIGRVMGIPVDKLFNLGLAAALADIGLQKVPARIRDKKTSLTKEEWNFIKQHITHSAAVARKFRLHEDIITAITQHHERNDGSGYPFGIKGKDIHVWAQIIAVADTYDAIVSDRPYRKAEPAFAASEILMAHCSKLNPKMIAYFLKNVNLYPQKGTIMLSNKKKGEIVYLNKQYPDRPIVLVKSESDFMGRRYIDLTKELTVFVEDIE